MDLTWDRVDFQRGDINLCVGAAKTRKLRAIVPMNAGNRAVLQTAHDAALSDYVIEYVAGPVKSLRNGFEMASERARLQDVTLLTDYPALCLCCHGG
ncbi:hypothetical protein [Tritonibacter scottomollicae]|uniref:hypothetical protein n=1 Tax=Tritonibacter scottomollicae TaxID=483013 RepID=UPI003AA8CFA2